MWAPLMNSALGAGRSGPEPRRAWRAWRRVRFPKIFGRCRKMIAERREHPTDDLTSVLVHAEIDGQKLEEHEIVMGFFLLVAAGNDSTKATYCSGMHALMEHPDQMTPVPRIRRWSRASWRRPCACFRPSLTSAAPPPATPSISGQKIREGEKVVMWYVSSNRG